MPQERRKKFPETSGNPTTCRNVQKKKATIFVQVWTHTRYIMQCCNLLPSKKLTIQNGIISAIMVTNSKSLPEWFGPVVWQGGGGILLILLFSHPKNMPEQERDGGQGPVVCIFDLYIYIVIENNMTLLYIEVLLPPRKLAQI